MEKMRVIISNKQKKVKIPSGIRLLVRRCCHAVIVEEKLSGEFEVSVSFVDNMQIRQLNKEYRDKDTSTDVLSFPLGVDGVFDVNPETNAKMLGDIVISLETAEVQAKTYGHSIRREIGFLTVHSMLHLLGYDHEEDKLAATVMHEKEEEILKILGLSRTESVVRDED